MEQADTAASQATDYSRSTTFSNSRIATILYSDALEIEIVLSFNPFLQSRGYFQEVQLIWAVRNYICPNNKYHGWSTLLLELKWAPSMVVGWLSLVKFGLEVKNCKVRRVVKRKWFHLRGKNGIYEGQESSARKQHNTNMGSHGLAVVPSTERDSDASLRENRYTLSVCKYKKWDLALHMSNGELL